MGDQAARYNFGIDVVNKITGLTYIPMPIVIVRNQVVDIFRSTLAAVMYLHKLL